MAPTMIKLEGVPGVQHEDSSQSLAVTAASPPPQVDTKVERHANIKAKLNAQPRMPTIAPPSPQRQRRSKATPVPLYVASTKKFASESTQNTDRVDPKILRRIEKMLARGDELRNTSEAEAKTAVRMAHRVMMEYNIREADMEALEKSEGSSGPPRGASVVRIGRPKKYAGKQVKGALWHSTLANAMDKFFKCGHYSQSRSSLIYFEYIFHGLARNSEVAAKSFQTTFNIMQEWTVRRNSTGNKDYFKGFAKELLDTAREEERAETEAAWAAEVRAGQSQETQTSRLEDGQRNATDKHCAVAHGDVLSNGHIEPSIKQDDAHVDNDGDVVMGTGSEHGASVKTKQDYHTPGESLVYDAEASFKLDEEDDDDDCVVIDADYIEGREEPIVIDLTADSDDESDDLIDNGITNGTPQSPSDETATVNNIETSDMTDNGHADETEQQHQWSSALQLQRFRDVAHTAEASWLESNAIKLDKGRLYINKIDNWVAYKEGVVDSRKIDVRHNRIEDE